MTGHRGRRAAGRAAARLAARSGLALLAAALLIAAAPVTLATAAAVYAAWLGGWPPVRLVRAAAWCLPMLAAWLAATAVATGGWTRVAGAPYFAWLAMWQHGSAGAYAAAAVLIAPIAIPAGLLLGAAAWSLRIRAMAAGAAGRSPAAAVAFDQRLWRHQARSAVARIAAPGAAPLTLADGEIVTGAVIRAVGLQARDLARLPYQRLRSHQVVIGGTGTGNPRVLLLLTTPLPRFGCRSAVPSRHFCLCDAVPPIGPITLCAAHGDQSGDALCGCAGTYRRFRVACIRSILATDWTQILQFGAFLISRHVIGSPARASTCGAPFVMSRKVTTGGSGHRSAGGGALGGVGVRHGLEDSGAICGRRRCGLNGRWGCDRAGDARHCGRAAGGGAGRAGRGGSRVCPGAA